MVNAQEWLDKNYPKEQRKEITKLNISYENLQGSLDLSDFVNLEELNCKHNKLTSLGLSNCVKLKEISCSYNQLTELKVNNLSNLALLNCGNNQLTTLNLDNCLKLEKLWCYNNNFPEQDLSMFSKLVELEVLSIENYDQGKIKKGIYNRFKGSLEPLKNLTKLKELWINNTNINSGLEYLPESVEYFSCEANKRKKSKVKTLYNLFANKKGEVETHSYYGNIINFPKKLKDYKQKKLQETITLTNPIFTEHLSEQKQIFTNPASQPETIANLTEESPQLQNKKQELTQLIDLSQKKLNEYEQDWLENLLEMQEELTKSQGADKTAQKQLTKAKEKLSKKLRKSEMENLCELQDEITQLENQLINLQVKDTQDQQALQLQPAYGTPGSSNNPK